MILQRDLSAPHFYHQIHCRSVIGNLNFLNNFTQGNISYATHQAELFYKDPRRTHGADTENISGYLYETRDTGFILDSNHPKSSKVYDAADFCGNWYRPTTSDEPSAEKSWSGYVLLYIGFPIVWASKLQMVISLSTTNQSMFFYHSHWDIWFRLWDQRRKWKRSVLKPFRTSQLCIARHLRITLELLILNAFQRYSLLINKSTFCFINYVSTHIRDLYIYNKFLRMTSAMTHGLSRFHRSFF